VGWSALVTVTLTAAHVEGLAGLGVPEVLEAIQTLGLAASSRSHTIRVPTVRENTAFLIAHAEAELLVLKASPWAVRATMALAVARYIETTAHGHAHPLVCEAARPALATCPSRGADGVQSTGQNAALLVAKPFFDLLVICTDVAILTVLRWGDGGCNFIGGSGACTTVSEESGSAEVARCAQACAGPEIALLRRRSNTSRETHYASDCCGHKEADGQDSAHNGTVLAKDNSSAAATGLHEEL